MNKKTRLIIWLLTRGTMVQRVLFCFVLAWVADYYIFPHWSVVRSLYIAAWLGLRRKVDRRVRRMIRTRRGAIRALNKECPQCLPARLMVALTDSRYHVAVKPLYDAVNGTLKLHYHPVTGYCFGFIHLMLSGEYGINFSRGMNEWKDAITWGYVHVSEANKTGFVLEGTEEEET